MPAPDRGEVLVHVGAASVCGTDLHIYNWDPWAQGRIHLPLIPGHEFCGTVAAVGRGVTTRERGRRRQRRDARGLRQVPAVSHRRSRTSVRTCRILGVDADGAFACLRGHSRDSISGKALPSHSLTEYGSLLDPLGNAVHTVLAGPISPRRPWRLPAAGRSGCFPSPWPRLAERPGCSPSR